jgi:NifU-like protein involved in Fe-S cluster formation
LNKPARAPLYTPAMLEAAVGLAAWPLAPDLPRVGEARSRTCGSTARIGIALDRAGKIARLGCRVQACAVGQAATSLFLRHAPGLREPAIADARAEIARWLRGGDLPSWPGFALIAPARAHSARHGAILLAWDAALAALASQPALR